MTVKIINSKITCRQGVFETNSSSMHSLVVMKDIKTPFPATDKWKPEDDEDGKFIINVTGNDYGRCPLEFLGHPVDKFLYLLADRYGRYSDNDDERDNFISKMVKKLDGCEKFIFGIDNWDGKTDYGYVDHQSSGDVWGYIEDNNIDPLDFIFDPKQVIIIDGDEYCHWKEMKESGLIQTDNVEFDLNESWGDE